MCDVKVINNAVFGFPLNNEDKKTVDTPAAVDAAIINPKKICGSRYGFNNKTNIGDKKCTINNISEGFFMWCRLSDKL